MTNSEARKVIEKLKSIQSGIEHLFNDYEFECEDMKVIDVMKTIDACLSIMQEYERLQSIVREQKEALEKLARLGNGNEYGNSDGNRIAKQCLDQLEGETK